VRPILFSLGPWNVASYGVLIALGGTLSACLWYNRRRQMGIKNDDDFWILANVVILGVFFGAHLLYVFQYHPPFSGSFWKALIRLDRGFVFFGSVIGAGLGLVWFSRHTKIPLLRVLDYIFLTAPIGHGFGRLGCFMAGCCHGVQCDLPWAVTFVDPQSGVAPRLLGVPLHPTQLYEFLGEVVIFSTLFFLILPRVERGKWKRGTVCAAYLALYGLLRFGVEFWRGDTTPWILGLTSAQGVSLGLIAAGAALLALPRKDV
jgi:phosphatidylglycerol---prolipoprotein diacylglyceryl transferase